MQALLCYLINKMKCTVDPLRVRILFSTLHSNGRLNVVYIYKLGENHMETYDVVIVGAGQAGIATGFYLKQTGLSFMLIDSNKEIGDSWRKRYDSLVLFTPRKYSSLPGLRMNGLSEGFPTKNEMASYLQQYVIQNDLPIKLNTTVIAITKKHEVYQIETNHGMIHANQVVVASGAFQKPFVPPVVINKGEKPFQIHSSTYRSEVQIPEGPVLVVGGGNSGAQIAVELSEHRQVTMAVSHPLRFLPIRVLGKTIFHWLDTLGLLHAGTTSIKGKWFKKQKDPIFGKELKGLLADRKVNLKPRVIEVDGDKVKFEDNSEQSFQSIIWSTGFTPSYEWIQIEGVISTSEHPMHERGVSPIKGLYFIGLPWQHKRGSALVCGVGIDAAYIVTHINKESSRF